MKNTLFNKKATISLSTEVEFHSLAIQQVSIQDTGIQSITAADMHGQFKDALAHAGCLYGKADASLLLAFSLAGANTTIFSNKLAYF